MKVLLRAIIPSNISTLCNELCSSQFSSERSLYIVLNVEGYHVSLCEPLYSEPWFGGAQEREIRSQCEVKILHLNNNNKKTALKHF